MSPVPEGVFSLNPTISTAVLMVKFPMTLIYQGFSVLVF